MAKTEVMDKTEELKIEINDILHSWHGYLASTSRNTLMNKINEYAQQVSQDKDGLIEAQDEYIKLLGNEIDDLIGIAHVHGWKSQRVEQGEVLRKRLFNEWQKQTKQ